MTAMPTAAARSCCTAHVLRHTRQAAMQQRPVTDRPPAPHTHQRRSSMLIRTHRLAAGIACAFVAAAGVFPADDFAQNAAKAPASSSSNGATDPGRISVTAQRSPKEMQDVPTATSIVTARQLDIVAATDLSRMNLFVSGLQCVRCLWRRDLARHRPVQPHHRPALHARQQIFRLVHAAALRTATGRHAGSVAGCRHSCTGAGFARGRLSAEQRRTILTQNQLFPSEVGPLVSRENHWSDISPRLVADF